MAVEISKAADSVYSFMSCPIMPTTNILVPSLENAMPVGLESCEETSKGGGTKVAVEASKVPSMRFSDVSRTAPGSIVSSGVVSPATVARCGTGEGKRDGGAVGCTVKLGGAQGHAASVTA